MNKNVRENINNKGLFVYTLLRVLYASHESNELCSSAVKETKIVSETTKNYRNLRCPKLNGGKKLPVFRFFLLKHTKNLYR